jgi:CelD/BcsL family acetyltransferase involved in cellulose biosynthesis
MKVERIENYERFIQLKEDWNTLLSLSGQHKPFLSHQWFDAWWQSFGREGEQEVLVFSDETGSPEGIAPMMVRDDVLRFMANHEVTDYCDFISSQSHRKEFYQSLADYFRKQCMRYSRMEFINIPGTSPTLSEMPLFADEHDFQCELEESETVPVLALPDSYDKYIQSIGRKNRHELRRKIRKLEGLRDVRLERITGSEQWGAAIEKFVLLHSESDREKREFWHKPGMFDFFDKLAAFFFAENWAELQMLYEEKRLMAALLNFKDSETLYFYNAAYDKEFSPYSPGFFLFDHAIKQAIAENIKKADFLRGREKYKYFFGAEDSKIYTLKLAARKETP